jgi:hypothetical protein
MSELLQVLAFLAALLTLDVLALRYGYDSRDGMRPEKPSGMFR